MRIQVGFELQTCVKEILHICKTIRAKRKLADGLLERGQRRRLATKLKQLRAQAWMYFFKLPVCWGAGWGGCPWRFASIRPDR